MKLNYRDRIILLVVIAIFILVGGFFLLIKPKSADIEKNKTNLDAKQVEWDGLDEKIQQNDELKDSILETYDKATKLSNDFPTVNSYTYQLDQFMQPIVDKCHVVITNLEVSDVTEESFSYYFFTNSSITSSMFAAADVNGNYQKNADDKNAESTAISERTEETVFRQQYGITAKGSKKEIWKFMDEIKNQNKAIIIESVSIDDYQFAIPEGTELEWHEVDGVEVPVNPDPLVPDQGYSQVTFVVSFYSVCPMDAPNVD